MDMIKNIYFSYDIRGVIIWFANERTKKGFNMDEKERIDVYLHFLMCFIGGFLGAYALLNRMDNFGSAQTSNLIALTFSLLGKNLVEFMIHLGAFLLYSLAIGITVIFTHKTKINLKRYAMLVNAAGFVCLALLPKNMNPVVALYPIFFMTATQWSVFHGAKGYNCSTIFSTNNIKQTILAYTNYYFEREEKELKKGKFYLSSLLVFYIGAGASYVACMEVGILATLFCILPTFLAFYYTHKEAVVENFIKEHAIQKQTIEI